MPNAEPTITPQVALAASLGAGFETAPALVITPKLVVKKAPLPLARLRLFFIVERSLRRLPTRLAQGSAYGDWVPLAGTVGIVMLAFYSWPSTAWPTASSPGW